MNNHKCFVGLIPIDEGDDLATQEEFIRDLLWRLDFNNKTIFDFLNSEDEYFYFSFKYCPVCGKKINWNDIIREAKERSIKRGENIAKQ